MKQSQESINYAHVWKGSHKHSPEKFYNDLKLIKPFINNNTRLLDIGCGSGAFLELIAKNYYCKLYGLDITDELFKISNYYSNVYFKKGTILNPPFLNESFSIVCMNRLLHHITSNTPKESYILVEKAIKNAFNLLENGGYLYLKEPYYEPEWFTSFAFSFKKKLYKIRVTRF